MSFSGMPSALAITRFDVVQDKVARPPWLISTMRATSRTKST
jgi:hypothetical protein